MARIAQSSQGYADRAHAGRVLARELGDYAARADVVVLGLPRGGVPVGAQVANALGVPLDALVVRKLGLPGQPELAMGAIARAGDEVELVRNESVRISADAFERVYRAELAELQRRETFYREGRPALPLRDRVVIVVDDGLATGATMRAAVAAVRRQRPRQIVVAVPVAVAETCDRLRREVDAVVCPWTPFPFYGVGRGYRDFNPTPEADVLRLLGEGSAERGNR